jgi:hypothetical protein
VTRRGGRAPLEGGAVALYVRVPAGVAAELAAQAAASGRPAAELVRADVARGVAARRRREERRREAVKDTPRGCP